VTLIACLGLALAASVSLADEKDNACLGQPCNDGD
jgi:hypothetical protein